MTQNLFRNLKLNLAVLTLTLIGTHAFGQATTNDLPNFRQVSSDIYRGGRPTAKGLKILQQKGIKFIINLENSNSAIKSEEKQLKGTGIQFVSIPFGSFSTPRDTDVKKVLTLLNQAQNFPIYIHCLHGEDRTGLMIALYRVEHGMAPADAYKEMLAMGFHRILFPLNHYFEKATGFDD
jgi:tyrosine-protein phosphatase SIW14